MPITLQIDDIVLDGIEVPETIDSLGTKQAVVIKEFPGGARQIRNLGAFPLPFSFHGILSGPAAFDRKVALERKAATGQSIVLSYGPFAWLGQIVRFEAHPRHQFYCPYVLHFEPTQDLTGITQSGQQGPSPETQLAAQQATLNVLKQAGTAAPTDTTSL